MQNLGKDNQFRLSMRYGFLTTFFLVITFQIGFAQQAFTFLNLPSNAQISGLGGINNSTSLNVNGLWASPALADSSWNKQIALSFSPYLAGTKLISMAYGLPTKSKNQWAFGLQYLNYGTIPQTDAAGNEVGTFTAADYAIATNYSRQEGNFRLGANLKFVGSGIEIYQSYALLADVGGVFKHPKHNFTIGLSIKNIGLVFKPYFSTNPPTLPLDVQLGITFKPQYMPIRVSLTAHHLYQWDISYNDPLLSSKIDANGNRVLKPISFIENAGRHFVFGVEILAHKNISILLGYNHLRKQELRLSTVSGGAGLSGGLLYKSQKFGFTYSYAAYHLAGGLHSFSLEYRF